MHTMNQQLGSNSNHYHFNPVSRSISQVGTTVSYSLNPTTNVNALSSGGASQHLGYSSGNLSNSQFLNYAQPNWSSVGYSGFSPVVSASHFNNSASGNYMHPQSYYVRSTLVQPSVDISETSSDVVITACVGNLEISDLNLNATDNSVTISGNAWTGSENLVLNRTVALPTSIRAESIDANYQSGIVEIRCPKTEKFMRQRTTINSDTIQSK